MLRLRKYFLSVPLVACDSTDSYSACWSIFTELFGLHPVCRHETYPVTIFHITFYFFGWICAVLQIGYSSVACISSRINKVTTISVQVGLVVERVTLGHPPPLLIPFPLLSIIPQLMSVTFNPLKTKAIQSHDYSTTFLFIKKTVLCRSQLRCVVIRVLDKTSEITVSKDAYSVAQFVAALPYKAEGRGFDSRWGRCIFYWFNPSGITVALGSTQLLIEGVQGVSPGV